MIVYVYLATQRSAERELLLANRKLERSRDQANEATRAKSQFLANMSHEIRTPMNVIFGMTEMIEAEGGLSRDQRDCLGRTRNAASTLLALVDDILDVSRIEAGKMQLENLELEIRSVLEEVADLLRPRATEKGLYLACRVASDVPAILRGDPVRLRQVVTNLVGNAVKFTERGHVAIEAGLVEDRGRAATIAICVEDTGIGIPLESHAEVFESFTQADGSSTRRFGGTGLGLTICRELVQLMGGSIQLASEEGCGSRFRVVLPLEKGRPRTPSEPARIEPPDEDLAAPRAPRAVNQ